MAKVSVIMPSLNVVEYIEKCLQSVINQTLNDIEIICIDANSDDGTYEILKSYKEKDERILLLSSEIRSYGYQVNLGIRNANSKYISIVETDDYIEPDMLEKLFYLSEKNDLEFIKGDYNSFYTDEDGNIVSNCVKMFSKNMQGWYGRVINPSDNPFLHNMGLNIWRGIYNRQFIIDNNIWLNETKGAAFQDISFYHRLISKANRAMFVEEAFYYYRGDRNESSFRNKKSLIYVHDEYKSIIEGDQQKYIREKKHLHYIYIKMVNEFLIHINSYINNCNFCVNIVEEDKYVTWMIKVLNKAKNSHLISCNDFNLCDWEDLIIALSDMKTYVKMIKVRNENLLEMQRSYYDIISNKRVVLFGIGNYGRRAMNSLRKNNCQIVAVCDNLRFNEMFYGYEVLKPEKCAKCFSNEYFVIANKYEAGNMKEQLEAMGVDFDRILEYRNYE